MSIPEGPWTIKQLEERFPWVKWREPALVMTSAHRGLACRVCIARHGMKGSEVRGLPQSFEEFEEHWRQEHEAA
jgi:hypothetical protein